MSIKPLYIFDLDGTLADISHRIHFLKNENDHGRWDKFFKACIDDTPVRSIVETYNQLIKIADVWIFTGRPESVREETENWICRNTLTFRDGLESKLVMRPTGDHTPDDLLKELWLRNMLEIDRRRLVGVFDDRNSVVNMWRRNNVTCFQVKDGDY